MNTRLHLVRISISVVFFGTLWENSLAEDSFLTPASSALASSVSASSAPGSIQPLPNVSLSRPEPPVSLRGNSKDVHFYLYTKDNMDDPDELIVADKKILRKSRFLLNRPTKIMVHGFYGNTNESTFPQQSFKEYMKYDSNQNIILVDWKKLSSNVDYNRAVANTEVVSNRTASMIEFLVRQMVVKREDIHLIGFSLGAQIVGQVGSRVSKKLTRITALDPALPWFDFADSRDRIDPSDAHCVEVVHTNGGFLGMYEPVGTVDWYPNGGRIQPGCGLDMTGSCAHLRGPELWKESIHTTVGFRGVKCSSFRELQRGKCKGNETELMGQFMPLNTTGIYFLTTRAEAPYAEG